MFHIFLTTFCLTRIRIKTFTLVWWIRMLGYQHGAQVRKGGGKSSKFMKKRCFLFIFPQPCSGKGWAQLGSGSAHEI